MRQLQLNIFSSRPPVRAADLEPILGKVTTDGGLLRKPSWFGFTMAAGPLRLTVDGEAYWTEQRAGLKGYAATFLAEDDPVLQVFAQQVDSFVSIYALHGTGDIEPGDELCRLMERVAEAVEGVVFAWGSVIVPGYGVLFGPLAQAKEPDFPTATEEQLQGVVRTSLDHPEPTERQLDRRARNSADIRALGLPVLDSLPVLEDDAVITVRPVAEVVRRMLCIAICAVKAEKDDPDFIDGLLKRYQVGEWLSPEERDFLAAHPDTDRERAKFSWRYECVHVLQWWLGLEPTLMPPAQVCQVAPLIQRLHAKTTAELIAEAKPRTRAELLDANDLYYRLHWAAIELRLKRKKHPAVDEGVVMERHYALNWIARYHDTEWDDVPTDT